MKSKTAVQQILTMGLPVDPTEISRLFFESYPTPILIYAIDTLNFLAVNDSAINQYGYSRKEFLSLTAKDIRLSENLPHFEQTIALSTTKDWRMAKVRHKKKNGEIIYVETFSHEIDFQNRKARIVNVRDISDMELVEKTHDEDSELWRRFMDNIPDSIYFKNPHSQYTRINAAHAKVLGVASPDDAIGKTDFDFLPPGHSQRAHKLEQQIIKSGKPVTAFIEDVRLRDGKQHWFSTTKMPLTRSDGTITGIFGSSHDITELKQIETTLSRSSEQRKLLLNISQSILSEISLNDVLKKIFQALEQVLSFDSCGLYTLDELNKTLRPTILIQPELISPKLSSWSIPAGKGILSDVVKTGKGELVNNAHLDARSVYPDVKVPSCEHLIAVPVIVKGRPLGLIFVSRQSDPEFTQQEFETVELFISHVAFAIEHARLFEQIMISEERYRELFEESRDVIFISTPDGRFKDINPAGVGLFGYDSKKELLQLDVREHLYLNPEDRIRYQNEMERNGYVKDFEIPVRTKNGETKVLLETATPIRDEKNAIIGYRGIMRDITQLKDLQQRLLQAQKLESLGTLAGGIAHDFNNILSIIIAYASRIEQNLLNPGEISQSVDIINKASWRGAEIIKRILTFARKTETITKSVNINHAIEEVGKLLRETFPRTITITLELMPELPRINADYNQIHQAIINLCVNARDAMSDGGTITMRSLMVDNVFVRERFPDAKKNPYIAISITDTGRGMNDETLARIFEPFFTTKEQGKGTGLGLAMVYGIIQNHDGFIDVESSLAKGTTFTLYLPVSSDPDMGIEALLTVEKLSLKGKETILVVEDESMLTEYLKQILEGDGYTVLTADDGNRAVEIYRANKNEIALVFSDMGLPGMNGWDAIKIMRQINPSLKVIFATGYLDPDLRNEISRAGVQEFMQKPYNPEEIQIKIREVLDGKR
jgi:two-component system, cell cycle sensor histidine kinase and response regulator CckA